MSPEQDPQFETIKSFLETKPASRKAISCLKKEVEIGIQINGEKIYTYTGDNGNPILSPLPPTKHDVLFNLSGSAIEKLGQLPAEDMGEFGIEVVKLVLDGEIKIKVVGSMIAMARNGYLKIIKEAGPSFLSFLAKNGVSGLSKIPGIFKNLRG